MAQNANPAPLVLNGLEVALRGRVLLRQSLQVQPGQIVSVMGPSGVGKSTLLAAIVGALGPEFRLRGQVMLGGKDVSALPTEARGIGMLFQDPLLFPHLSVAQNLAFGLARQVRGAARHRAVEAALADIGLAGFGPRDPATLSGGQKARVALMRTLLAAPRALLLDEPFSALDADLRGQMRDVVFGRARQAHLPVVMVTHDPQDAAAAGGPVVHLAAPNTPAP
jgi:putative thiamine transport system ATP-binding protein